MSESIRVKQDGTPFKARVEIDEKSFFQQYKAALATGMKLPEFSKQIGQAPATIQQRVAKANNKLKASGYDKRWKYLSNATGATRGRKSLTGPELLELLGD